MSSEVCAGADAPGGDDGGDKTCEITAAAIAAGGNGGADGDGNGGNGNGNDDGDGDEKEIDTARSVLLSYLPSSLQDESLDSFTEIIYEVLEKTFNVSKETVDDIIRYPRLDPAGKEFGCKCVIIFRSRVQKHRVIAQKSKLDAPTTIDAMTDVPKELHENNDEDLEMADECGDEDEEGRGDLAGHRYGAASTYRNYEHEQASSKTATNSSICNKIGEAIVEDTQNVIDVFYDDDDNDNGNGGDDEGDGEKESVDYNDVVVFESESVVYYDTDRSAKIADADSRKKEKSSGLKETERNVGNKAKEQKEKKSGTVKGKGDKAEAKSTVDTQKMPPLLSLDVHKEHFLKLPLEWTGAPEFQWRKITTNAERRHLIIENALRTDLQNPWLYPAVMRARHVEMFFPQYFLNEIEKDSLGKISLYFFEEMALVTVLLNYLVYVRTGRGRRLKFYLPQTKTIEKFKDDLEQRLGRKREPTLPMRQLIVKPISDTVTENELRTAFEENPIENVEFKTDILNHRCAVVTFSTAERTIAAHSFHDYVQLSESGGKKGWVTVLYPCIAIRDWGRSNSLLTRAELKQFVQDTRSQTIASSSSGTPKEVIKAAEVTTPAKRGFNVNGKDDMPPWKKARGRGFNRGVSSAFVRGASSARGNWRGTAQHSRAASFRSRGRSDHISRRSRRSDDFAPNNSGDYGRSSDPYNGPREMYHDVEGRYDTPEADYSRRDGRRDIGDHSQKRFESERPRIESRRSAGDSYRGQSDNYRSVPQDSDAVMEERIREQRKQLALQEHLLRQQQIIDDLEIQLRTHAPSGAVVQYDPSFESIDTSESSVQQNYSARGTWNGNGPYAAEYIETTGGGRMANYNLKWR